MPELAIIEPLAHSDPENTFWQRDLMVSYNDLGDALGKQDHLEDALAAYRSSLAIVQHLLSQDSKNATWQSDLQFVADRIGGLGYSFALARDFNNAMGAAEQAILATPAELWLYAIRADALMFLGRIDEARAIFLKYRGQKLGSGQTWEAVVLEDFSHFRQAGLTSPLMAEIEKQFKVTG